MHSILGEISKSKEYCHKELQIKILIPDRVLMDHS